MNVQQALKHKARFDQFKQTGRVAVWCVAAHLSAQRLLYQRHASRHPPSKHHRSDIASTQACTCVTSCFSRHADHCCACLVRLLSRGESQPPRAEELWRRASPLTAAQACTVFYTAHRNHPSSTVQPSLHTAARMSETMFESAPCGKSHASDVGTSCCWCRHSSACSH
jgi:hypothetical protein